MVLSPDPSMGEEDLLFGSVLIHSYALAESATADCLGRTWGELGAIERWGEELLEAEDKTWAKVSGGRAGAVEVSVVRNIYAHGRREIDAESAARLERVDGVERTVGDSVLLSYGDLRKYRGRLQSLLNQGGIR